MDGIREFADLMGGKNERQSKRANAIVTRIDDEGTVWVHLDGGADETPVHSCLATVKAGDVVPVTFRSGRAEIGGNASDLPASSAKVDGMSNIVAQAQKDATRASVAAESAEKNAESAKTSANKATYALSEVENVVGTLNWIAEHGTYSLTEDTSVVPEKVYYTRSGTSPDYTYTVVANPVDSELSTYYELELDESIQNFINTHVWLTDEGLFVGTRESGYKVRIDSDSFDVIDPNGAIVSTYGTETRIGQDDSSNVSISPLSIKMTCNDELVPFEVTVKYLAFDEVEGGTNKIVTELPSTISMEYPTGEYTKYAVEGPRDSQRIFPQHTEEGKTLPISTVRNSISYDSDYYSYDKDSKTLTVLDSSIAQSILNDVGYVVVPIAHTIYTLNETVEPTEYGMDIRVAGESTYPIYVSDDWSELSDESTLPVTPCFVFNRDQTTEEFGLFWCSGDGIYRVSINRDYETMRGDLVMAEPPTRSKIRSFSYAVLANVGDTYELTESTYALRTIEIRTVSSGTASFAFGTASTSAGIHYDGNKLFERVSSGSSATRMTLVWQRDTPMVKWQKGLYLPEASYPTFIRSSWSTSSDESTLPVTPCFVLSTSDNALHWCSGNGIIRLNPVYAAVAHNHDSAYVNITGDTMTGQLKFKDGNALPNASTSTDFFAVGMNAFANGGRLAYKGLADFKTWLGLAALAYKASLAESDIPNLGAGKITSGTFAAARIPTLDQTKVTPIYYQAHGSGNLSMTAGTITKVTLVTSGARYDGTGLSIASGGIKIATAGRYRVTAGAYVSVSGSNASAMGVYVKYATDSGAYSAASEVLAAVDHFSGANAGAVFAGPKIFQCAANSILYLAARAVGGSGTCDQDNESTYLLVERLS